MHPCGQGDAVEEKMSEQNVKTVEKSSAVKSLKKPTKTPNGEVSLNVYYGVKAGMTRIFNEQGQNIPVTVIKLVPNVIAQVKTLKNDGYEAYKVAYNAKKIKTVTNADLGQSQFQVAPTLGFDNFSEVKCAVNPEDLGKTVSLDAFEPDSYIDVSGVTKGKGFQGVIKRHHFAGGPGAHGSTFHRTTGSIGNRATPGRVFKNKKMPGHMGDINVTMQNLKVVAVNKEQGYMLIKGSIPGHKNSFVKISKALKKA